MSRIVNIVTEQVREMHAVPSEIVMVENEKDIDENIVLKNKLLKLVAVLQQGGQFRGFNRKIQIRPLKWEKCSNEDTSDYSGSESAISISQPVLRNAIRRTNSDEIRHSYDVQHDSSCEDEHGLQQVTKQVSMTPALPTSPFELRRGVEKVDY